MLSLLGGQQEVPEVPGEAEGHITPVRKPNFHTDFVSFGVGNHRGASERLDQVEQDGGHVKIVLKDHHLLPKVTLPHLEAPVTSRNTFVRIKGASSSCWLHLET